MPLELTDAYLRRQIHVNHIPQMDCTVACKLREAGTILLGKLNTHEYAYGVTTNNPHFGPTRNPWDLDRIPAGSSGLGGTFGFVLAEALDIHAASLRERPEDFGSDVRELLSSYSPGTTELMAGQRAIDALTAAMRTLLETVDVLLTPTTSITAVRIGQESVRYGHMQESILGAMIRCTAPFNATHLPALSLPCGLNRAGLPIGMQIEGRPFDEATVLRVGHAYEQATDWHLRSPVL